MDKINRKLKILFDVTILASGLEKNSGRGGIFFVALNVLRKMVEREDVQIYFYSQEFYKEAVKEYLRLNPIPFLPTPIAYLEYENYVTMDAFISPVFKIPEEIERFSCIKKYIILHDAIPALFPEYYPNMTSDYWFNILLESLNNEDTYFTVSDNTKRDFMKLIPQLREEQFVTTHLGVDKPNQQYENEILIRQLLGKYDIPSDKRYVLALGSLVPRKNIIRTIESFQSFIQKNEINDLILILVGDLHDMESKISNSIKNDDKIYFTGYVSDYEKDIFYANALWFVYTSHYEGFGLPPLEAMGHGTPVIVSNSSCFEEVIGDSGIMVKWDSEEEHVAAFEKYYFDAIFRNEMAKKGIVHSKKFSWEKTVDIMVNTMSSKRKLNIAFDGTAIFGPMSKNRGIGNYATGLFTTLINQDKENNYFFYNIFEETELSELIDDSVNFKERFLFFGRNHQFINNDQFEKVLSSSIKRFLYENAIDIFIITSPFENMMLPYKKEWFAGSRTAAIVYDIIPYLFPERYFGNINENGKWYLERLDFLKQVDLCLTISDSAKEDMIARAGFEEKQIKTIWGAVDKKFHVMNIEPSEEKQLKLKFGIDSKIIMCTGGDDERKNIEALIQAYAAMPQELIHEYQLVVVCKISQDSKKKYLWLAEKCGVGERVVFTGFVSDEELVKFYNIAELVAFPSIYEGFGLPIVEAFACQTPVLTSSNSSLGQVAGDAAVLVDPYDVNDITAGLISALTQVDLTELVGKGTERLKFFQWEHVAELVLEALQSLKISEPIKVNRKIAMFTPMPPIQSGIADYSYDIIVKLSQYVDIDVFIDEGYKEECELPANVKCLLYKEFSHYVMEYDEIIYQVGNSLYHKYMWDYIKKYPGIVVLHDGNLHSVVYAGISEKNDYHKYKEILTEDYGEKNAASYIKSLLKQEVAPALDTHWVNGFVVNYAKKIIVHNFYLERKLLIKNIALDVEQIPLYSKISVEDSFKANREEWGYADTDIIIGLFGIVSYTKKVMEALMAFNKLAKENPNLRLVVVGVDSSAQDYVTQCKNYVLNNNLQQLVRFTGYVDSNLMEIYINMCDICINLRYRYKGESSASLAHILAQGKSVIVNDIGSFHELPDEACLKIPYYEDAGNMNEIDQIEEAIKVLMDSKRREELGKCARRYVKEELFIDKIVKKYYDCIKRPSYPVLPDAILEKLSYTELGAYTEQEKMKLADTIFYAKGF